MDYTVEVLPGCKDLCCLGEGPHWDEINQRLLFVDIDRSTVHRWNYANTSLEAPLQVPDPSIGAVVPREKGGLVVAAYQRFASLDETTGETNTIDQPSNNTNARFNDGKCDPQGRFWAGTMGLELNPAEPIPKQGVLYTLGLDQSVTSKKDNIDISNGLAWSSDGSTMYYIDSLTYKVFAYNFDPDTGAISDQKVLVEFDKLKDGTPDGQCIDIDGNLWVAMYFGGRLIKIDTTTGKMVQRIPISTTSLRTTSCCFGGPNMDELFVTTASTAEERSSKVVNAGSVFRVKGLGAKGLPGMPYKG